MLLATFLRKMEQDLKSQKKNYLDLEQSFICYSYRKHENNQEISRKKSGLK